MPSSVVTGSGGIGKTSLALRWAHQHLDRFPDGQLYVDMRGFASFEQPVPASRALRGFLGALGVGEDSQPADVETQAATYRSLVAGKRVLVVVDNAKDCADVLRLLPGSASCAVLVTSRLPLAELISRGARIVDLDVLTDAQARQLLAEHVGRERLAAEPGAVAELLGYCAGLPLAVGIVAARVVTQPGQSLAGLADELREESERLDGLDAGDTGMSLRRGAVVVVPVARAAGGRGVPTPRRRTGQRHRTRLGRGAHRPLAGQVPLTVARAGGRASGAAARAGPLPHARPGAALRGRPYPGR
ncbi:NB-ARC domain-containing protein [Actinokineospora terrae]|uniref:NB-ARC domain-containing protein n=1 Tax=Actinokineospora terrae TaxID=155974 RepID=UPI000A4EEDD8|nr:NB-ARC domain-containing protein [Actinokineospora terrae]